MIETRIRDLLEALGADLTDPNWIDTPRRVAEYFDYIWVTPDRFQAVLDDARRARFPTSYRGLVVQQGIKVWGTCPHHLLPIEYDIHIGYIPQGQAVGLSKLTRITEITVRHPRLQEDATSLLASTLVEVLETPHVAVIISGVHDCMKIRGVKQPSARTTTSEMRGYFGDNDAGVKDEFLRLISGGER